VAAQQASTSSSADELAGLQAQLDEAARRKVGWGVFLLSNSKYLLHKSAGCELLLGCL
jgi:hypothetical protein